MIGDIFSLLLTVLFIVNIVFGLIVVFFERKEPAVTWAWLMVIVFIPYFGFCIYLLLGLDSRKHKMFAQKARRDADRFQDILAADLPGLRYAAAQMKADGGTRHLFTVPGAPHLNDLLYLNHTSGMGAFTTNNRVTLFFDGNAKFDRMIEDIEAATRYVHLLYYIMRGDGLGARVLQALTKKAAQGVEVKLLVDGMGCVFTPKRFFQPLIDAGGDVAIFLPPLFVRMNFRNHRKICVTDGKIGYVGGLNIGDEYLGKKKRFGFWRDTHIRVAGDAAKELEIRFLLDWNFCAKNQIAVSDDYFPVLEKTDGGAPMQIVCSGPDTRQASIFHAYVKMIAEADKNIYIQTPYFAPDESIFHALKIAALSGIDVRVVFPAHPDYPFVYHASLSFLGELLGAGVRCYQYEKGFIHSKLIVMDGLVSSAGTANMDIRSFKLNFEVNAFLYDRQIANAFELQFLADLNDCTEITAAVYRKRSRATKIMESISRLLSPLL